MKRETIQKVNIRTLLALMGVSMFFASMTPANAADPRLIGQYSKWSAYVFTEGGDKVCYMASQPEKAEGNYTQRGEIFALVTHRPGENSKNVFSYVTGYPYKTGSTVSVDVDSRNFKLFTQDEMAWTPDQESDNRLTDAIRRGSKMVVKGTSKRGTLTTDTFSLKGSGAAYRAISQECGV